MKNLSRAVLFLAFLISALPLSFVFAESLLIVEVQIYGDKADNDFIKIYNSTDENINLSGYKLRKRTSTGSESSIRVLPSGSLIPGKGYFLWANSKEDFYLSVGADAWSTATLAKHNSVALMTPDNIILDALAWGESQSPFVKGVSFPENPGANQQLKRKAANGSYQNTEDNSRDFHLYPLQSEPSQPQIQAEAEPIPAAATDETSQLAASPPMPQPPPPAPVTQTVPQLKEPLRIDVNTASSQELQKLTGVGQVLAQRIIDARPFYSVDELTKVRGIGLKTLEDIKSQGLAWVDPTLKPPKIEKEAEPLTKGAAAIAEPIKAFDYPAQKSRAKPLSVFLVALGLAIFSGAIILIFKKKLKKEL